MMWRYTGRITECRRRKSGKTVSCDAKVSACHARLSSAGVQVKRMIARFASQAGSRKLMAEDAVRLDVWLWAARLFKTRAIAAAAIGGGKVEVNGVRAKRSKPL